MIVVDTSALTAIILNEPPAANLARSIELSSDGILISAGTIAEAMIVSAGRRRTLEMEILLESLDYIAVPVTEVSAKRAGDAYTRWGKGFHSAGLNFGDCFAYELAKNRDCPLLYIGNDFARTDVVSALPAEDRA